MTTTTVRLPSIFWNDHDSRDLPGGTLIRESKRFVYLEVTPDELDEIESDAKYYADEMIETAKYERDDWLLSICGSARSTVQVIKKIRSNP